MNFKASKDRSDLFEISKMVFECDPPVLKVSQDRSVRIVICTPSSREPVRPVSLFLKKLWYSKFQRVLNFK